MLTARPICIYPDGFRRRGCGSVTLGIAHHADVVAVKLDAGHVVVRTELVEPAQIVAEHDQAALPALGRCGFIGVRKHRAKSICCRRAWSRRRAVEMEWTPAFLGAAIGAVQLTQKVGFFGTRPLGPSSAHRPGSGALSKWRSWDLRCREPRNELRRAAPAPPLAAKRPGLRG